MLYEECHKVLNVVISHYSVVFRGMMIYKIINIVVSPLVPVKTELYIIMT